MRLALRTLAKSPGFTAIALLTLALGIGLNTSLFSLLNAVFLRSLPYAAPDDLVRIYRTSAGNQRLPHSPANFIDLRAQARSFSHLVAVSWTNYNLSQSGEAAARVNALAATGDFFGLLGVAPALGRVFGPEDDQPGREDVAVLSHGFWQARFAGDPAIIGRALRLDGQSVTVIGVLPAGFDDPFVWGRIDLWRPMAWSAETRANRGGNSLHLVARLKRGIVADAAQAELTALWDQLAQAYPASNAGYGLSLMSLLKSGQDATLRTLSWFTLALAGCVLLIACVNLANLQFARNALRAREQAVRAALGASRFQLMYQSLLESLLLAGGGGALGLLVALWGNDVLRTRIETLPGLEVPVDLRVLAFTFSAAALTGIGFGVLPAWLAARTDVSATLKQGGRGSTGGGPLHRIRHALIVAEVALALVLLSSAGFFLRGLERLADRDLGWRTDGVLTASLTLPAAPYASLDARRAFYDRLETRLAAQPGIERVALSTAVPFYNHNATQRFVVEGQPEPRTGAEPQRDVNLVTPGYFAAIGLVLVEGRGFTPADLTSATPPTIINETMAKQFWPHESAVGKRLAHPVDRQWQEVIGVVRDVRFPTNLAQPSTRFQSYRLLWRETQRSFTITLRTALPPETLAATLRRTVAEIDPDQPVQNIVPAEETIRQVMSNFEVVGLLLASFAALGLLLAALGIYGVIAGFVAQRTPEIGIRVALGAQLRDILRLVLGQGLKLALLGAALGLGGTFFVARALGAIIPALPGPEIVTVCAVTATLLGVALLACWLPARRATRVDPLTALRAE